jgi:hypothetical protein
MWFGDRLEINFPNIWWEEFRSNPIKELTMFQFGHGGDEYGNCSVYLSTSLIRIVVFPGLCFQRKVEMPDPGTNDFVDAMYWDDEWLQLQAWIREYTGRYYPNVG